jgi:hypothetical protein
MELQGSRDGELRRHLGRLARRTQATRQFLLSFKMVPIVEAVAVPFVAKLIEDGRFTGGDPYEKSARAMLDELLRWTNALRPLRSS